MKTGFDRLRGVAAASAMSLGLFGFGAGSVRASNVFTDATVRTKNLSLTGGAHWQKIRNTNQLFNAFNAVTATALTAAGSTIPTDAEAFAIINATTSGDQLFNAFNGALHLSIDGNFFANPGVSVDLFGDTLIGQTVKSKITSAIAATDLAPGIRVNVQYYSHPTRPILRALYSLENVSGAPQTIDARIAGGLGFGSGTTILIQATKDGDLITEDTDLWLVASNAILGTDPDKGLAGSSPVVTISRYGTGAAVIPTNSIKLDGGAGNFALNYDIPMSIGETANILIFVELNDNNNDATVCANDLETLEQLAFAQLLTGITPQQELAIVNYAPRTNTPPPVSTCTHVTGSSSGSGSTGSGTGSTSDDEEEEEFGALSIPSIAALLGLLGLARIRKNIKS